MQHFAKPLAAAFAEELAPQLDDLANRIETVNGRVSIALDGVASAVIALTAGHDVRVVNALADVKALLGVRARVDFVADEIRTQTRRFDSLEATAIGIAGGTLAAFAFFQAATKSPLGHSLVMMLIIPFVLSTLAISGYRVQEPKGTMLLGAEQQPLDVLTIGAVALEQLYAYNFAVIRRRGTLVQFSLTALVLLVLALIGTVVYSA